MNTSILSHKSTGAKIAGIVLLVGLLLGLALMSGFMPTARADYATSAISPASTSAISFGWTGSIAILPKAIPRPSPFPAISSSKPPSAISEAAV